MLSEWTDRKTLLAAGAGAVVGLLIGWLLIGWLLWPVQWVETYPWELRQPYKDAYVTMVADSLANNGDVDLARERLRGWNKQELAQILQGLIEEKRSRQLGLEAQHLEELRAALELPAVPGTPGEQPTPGPAPEEGGGSLTWLWILLIVLAAVVVAAALVVGRLTQRGKADRVKPPVRQAPPRTVEGETPLHRFVAAYRIGDPSYDESFSIDDPSGDFLGECGMAIAETLQEGTPDRVTAFEVWLFDKNDIRTVTKVLMSPWAYGDDEIRSSLAAKGEPIQAVPGQEVVLETQKLRVKATLREVSFGEEEPLESYFGRFVVDLDTYVKGTD